MRFLVKIYPSEADAKMAQGLLNSSSIDSVISPGSGSVFSINPFTGLDSNYELFVKDSNANSAKEILELHGLL